MKSHTVPRMLLDQFAYDHPKTGRRLWQYAKGRQPSGRASPTSATRIESHFADPADAARETEVETRLNQEFEDPVHKFLPQLRYSTFVLSPIQQRQLARYMTLLFNRSQNRRRATEEQVRIGIDSMRSFLADEEKVSRTAARWTLEIIRRGHPLRRQVTVEEVRLAAEQMIAAMQTLTHQQTTYVDSIERAMERREEALENGEWRLVQAQPSMPFVIGDAPVVTWVRLPTGALIHGEGFNRPNVEAFLPVAPTACLHILPMVQRTQRVKGKRHILAVWTRGSWTEKLSL